MEGHHGPGTVDGADPVAHLDPDVPHWRRRVHGAQSYALTVSYLGTNYFGWQKTEAGKSIQGEIEAALERILQEPTPCEAASRTDRGVHAEGQVVQFCTKKEFTPYQIQKALNGSLPQDIRIVEAQIRDFHPTVDAKSKTYHYHITTGPVQDPFCRLTSWHYHYPLDLQKMEQAAQELIGTKDFTAFTTEVRNDPICTIHSIQIMQTGNNLLIAITGNRFLYKMARRIAGTLANVGSGKINLGEVGVTAPAHGLTLHKIHYE